MLLLLLLGGCDGGDGGGSIPTPVVRTTPCLPQPSICPHHFQICWNICRSSSSNDRVAALLRLMKTLNAPSSRSSVSACLFFAPLQLSSPKLHVFLSALDVPRHVGHLLSGGHQHQHQASTERANKSSLTTLASYIHSSGRAIPALA